MFKKRIRVAKTAFLTVLVLTMLVACLWIISKKLSKGTGELKVLTGTADMAEGVKVYVGTTERIWTEKDGTEPNQKKKYFYRTQWAEVTGNGVDTGLVYEKPKVSEVKSRRLFSSLEAKLTGRHLPGTLQVKGNELSYDLIWYQDDGVSYYDNHTTYRIEDYVTFKEEDRFLYCYEGEEEPLEIGGKTFDNRSYTGCYLLECGGALYGYLDMEPEEEIQSIGQDIHMTVKKGIYRFEENGTATCVFSMGERAEGFEFLWLAAEEENTLTIIGKKGNLLLAYGYSLTDESIREEILWDAEAEPDALENWVKDSVGEFRLADRVTDGGRSYLCCTAIYGSQVNLTVFEERSRIFEGEVLERKSEFDGIDFSLESNGTNECISSVDKIEIKMERP